MDRDVVLAEAVTLSSYRDSVVRHLWEPGSGTGTGRLDGALEDLRGWLGLAWGNIEASIQGVADMASSAASQYEDADQGVTQMMAAPPGTFTVEEG